MNQLEASSHDDTYSIHQSSRAFFVCNLILDECHESDDQQRMHHMPSPIIIFDLSPLKPTDSLFVASSPSEFIITNYNSNVLRSDDDDDDGLGHSRNITECSLTESFCALPPMKTPPLTLKPLDEHMD